MLAHGAGGVFSAVRGAPLPAAPAGTTAPDRATLSAHLPAPGTGTLAAGARGRALRGLARLRAMPLLASVARAIPARWQARVKSWLSR